MKIYGINSDENEMADMEPVFYAKFAIENIDRINELLKKSDSSCQKMLVHLEILLIIVRRFSVLDGLPKPDRLKEWESTFNDWYKRSEKKISLKYRNGIKENAESIFEELKKYSKSRPF